MASALSGPAEQPSYSDKCWQLLCLQKKYAKSLSGGNSNGNKSSSGCGGGVVVLLHGGGV